MHAPPHEGVASRLGGLLFVFVTLALSASVVAWRSHERALARNRRFDNIRAIEELTSVQEDYRLAGPVRVAILRDPGLEGWHGKPAADSIINRWTEALHAIGADVSTVSPAAAARSRAADVLLVASSPCLGVDSRRALDAAAARHQGLLLAGAIGTMDGGCWRRTGYGLMTRFTGAGKVDVLEHRPEVWVTLPDGGPLATGLPPGSRLQVYNAAHLALRQQGRDGYYSDSALVPQPAHAEPLLDGAVTHAESGGVRVAYWGFDLRNVANDAWDRSLSSGLLRNSVAWAAGIPLAGLAPWPRGRVVAAVLAQDVEDEFENAGHALDSLQAAGAPGTFFLVSELARHHRDLSRRIAAYTEVGSHSDRHLPVGGLPLEMQLAALERTQRDLHSVVGHPVRGFRPPEEDYDEATLKAWARAGGDYVFAAYGARTAGPELFEVEGHTMVVFGRLIDDDFYSIVRKRRTDPGELGAEYLQGFQKVRSLGGLFLMSYHSQLLARPEFVPALARVARGIGADTLAWLTTGGAVAEWWRARHGVKLTITPGTDGEFGITVENQSAMALEGLVLRVVLPSANRAWAVEGGTAMESAPNQAWIAIPRLDAGAVQTLRISRLDQ